MGVKRVSPDEAQDLMNGQGYLYVDVRSIPEFEAGHPAGAYNVPLLHMGPRGMSPNPEFLSVMEKNFPKDAKLVIGCRSGGRSLQAAAMLLSQGYQTVVDQRAGYEGTFGAWGRPEPGWAPKGLPTSREPADGRSYEALKGEQR
jgi:rhodanese-related sulfurtransferase